MISDRFVSVENNTELKIKYFKSKPRNLEYLLFCNAVTCFQEKVWGQWGKDRL